MNSAITYVIIVLIIVIVLFLVFREVILWYFSIKERIELQKEQNFLLRKLCLKMGINEEELQLEMKKKVTETNYPGV